jgi:hypothetical protein
MKYSIQACIKTSNQGRRNAVKQLIPSPDDSRIWDIGYTCVDTVDEDGEVLIINASFHIKSERDGVVASMNGLDGVIQGCDFGSYIRKYKTWHDEAVNGVPPRPCEQEEILRRT